MGGGGLAFVEANNAKFSETMKKTKDENKYESCNVNNINRTTKVAPRAPSLRAAARRTRRDVALRAVKVEGDKALDAVVRLAPALVQALSCAVDGSACRTHTTRTSVATISPLIADSQPTWCGHCAGEPHPWHNVG